MDSFLWFYDIAKCFFLLCKKALSSLSFFPPKLDGGKPCFWIHRCVFVLIFGSITSLVLYCRPSIKLTRAALCRRTWVLFFELIILPLIFIFIFKLLLLFFKFQLLFCFGFFPCQSHTCILLHHSCHVPFLPLFIKCLLIVEDRFIQLPGIFKIRTQTGRLSHLS